MASVAVFNFQGFRSNVALNNLSQDIALLLRQAQTFGWSTRTDTTTVLIDQGIIQRNAYGVFFAPDGNNYSRDVVLYQKNDTSPNSEWFDQNQNSDVIFDTISITGPYVIVAIASAETKDDLKLINEQIPSNINPFSSNVSIAFSRPRPEAIIFEDQNPINSSSENYIGIYVGEPNQNQEAKNLIIIFRTGEIWVE
jgi:hypothetical protein